MTAIVNYFSAIKVGKAILWCYLIWYLITVYFHFDPAPRIWLNAVGISAVVGVALQLSVSARASDRWQTFRLFMMPFGVSSFSALIKGHGFIVIFSPVLHELLVSIAACVVFLMLLGLLKKRRATDRAG